MDLVQRVSNFFQSAGIKHLWVALVIGWSHVSIGATSAAFGLGQYAGGEYHGNTLSLELGHEDNYFAPGEASWQSAVRLTHFSNPGAIGQSLSLDQGIGGGVSLGVSGAKTTGIPEDKDKKGYEMNRLSGRFSFWLRESTLQVGLEGSSQKTKRDAREFQDTDGYVVRVASDASGSTATLRLTHLTTPTTILLSHVSQTRALGRPVALSFGGEVRQFIVPLKSSLHVGLDKYVDQDNVEKTTDYGKIQGDSQSLKYHQRIVPIDMILSSTTRWHQELETPRSVESETTKRHHFSQVFNLRYRLVEGAWTDETSEVSVFGGFFARRETQYDVETSEFIRLYGMQLKIVI